MEHNLHHIDSGLSRGNQRGFSLLETMFAVIILFIGITGLMSLFVVAAVRNTNNGDQATRTTEYAQDKMEQLLALNFNDTQSNVTGFPTQPLSCTNCGLYAGAAIPGTAGSLSTFTTYYSDYVDTNGLPVAAITSVPAAFTRYWYIETSTTGFAGMKRISVKVVANLSIGGNGVPSSISPTTTLVSFKSNSTYP